MTETYIRPGIRGIESRMGNYNPKTGNLDLFQRDLSGAVTANHIPIAYRH